MSAAEEYAESQHIRWLTEDPPPRIAPALAAAFRAGQDDGARRVVEAVEDAANDPNVGNAERVLSMVRAARAALEGTNE